MTAIVARRWLCHFINDAGEARTITVSLDRAEMQSAGSSALEAMARALSARIPQGAGGFPP
jgi:hypothetical protein